MRSPGRRSSACWRWRPLLDSASDVRKGNSLSSHSKSLPRAIRERQLTAVARAGTAREQQGLTRAQRPCLTRPDLSPSAQARFDLRADSRRPLLSWVVIQCSDGAGLSSADEGRSNRGAGRVFRSCAPPGLDCAATDPTATVSKPDQEHEDRDHDYPAQHTANINPNLEAARGTRTRASASAVLGSRHLQVALFHGAGARGFERFEGWYVLRGCELLCDA
jgi:hypothetical protein